jgi:hypothetical protein
MPKGDHTTALGRAAARRHHDTLARATETIETLDQAGQPITFSAVAVAAGVSRAWLYTQPDIRDLIVRLRSTRRHRSTTTTPSAQHATVESLRQRLEAAREEITHLRSENSTLRDQLARQLGHRRATTGDIRPINPR